MHQGIAALLGLQSWIVYRVEPGEGAIEVFVGKPRKEARGPVCGARTRRIHDRTRRWRRAEAREAERRAEGCCRYFHWAANGARLVCLVAPSARRPHGR